MEKYIKVFLNNFRMRHKFGDNYDICPNTFIMPEDYSRLLTEKELDSKGIWILKPVASSCGRGIRLISKGGKIPKRQYIYIMT